jgi:hypothetical protein
MFKTAKLGLDPAWSSVLARAERRVRYGLSRFARWASLRRIRPEAVDNCAIDRFVAELSISLGALPGRGMPSWRSKRTAVCAMSPCQRLGLHRPEFLGRSFRHLFEKTSNISSPGRRAQIRWTRELGQRPSPHRLYDCDESIFIPP